MKFVGGETAALSRVYEYFWKKVRRYSCQLCKSNLSHVPVVMFAFYIINVLVQKRKIG